MIFRPADIQSVLAASDLRLLVLETSGGSDKCPHCGSGVNLRINDNRQIWHCSNCGTGGDAIHWVKERLQLPFSDAVLWLSRRAHLEVQAVQSPPAPLAL